MSKKDKKIELQLNDAKVDVSGQTYEGYSLSMGKKDIGQIAEISSNQFTIVKNGNVEAVFKTLEKAVETIIENYNLNH